MRFRHIRFLKHVAVTRIEFNVSFNYADLFLDGIWVLSAGNTDSYFNVEARSLSLNPYKFLKPAF